MKTPPTKIIVGTLVLAAVFSCKKNETEEWNSKQGYSENKEAMAADSASVVSDSISSVATMKAKDRQFIKSADVDMEVKDVYDATIYVEKAANDLGGFVTESRLNTNVVSQDTYNTSNTDAILIKKFQTENTMQVRVPTDKLGEFLQSVNNKKLFLNTRVISAEDVTNNAKIAELEMKRIGKTGKVINKMKNNGDKVDRTSQNLSEENDQLIENMRIADDLKYCRVDLYIKEPQLRIAEIPVTNVDNIDNKYKVDFFFEAKNAVEEGFYLIQKVLLGFISVWPFILAAITGFYLYKKRKLSLPKVKTETSES